MRNTFITFAVASVLFFPVIVRADLDSDFKTCHRQIVNIGSDPELPLDQYCLGLSYQFGIGVPQSRREAVRWFDLAGDQGHDQANYFANHLRGGGNYIGFRNEDEQALVIGNRLRTVLLNIEPAGRTFHNSAERVAFLRQASQQADSDEEQQRWNMKKSTYDACVQAGRSDCVRP